MLNFRPHEGQATILLSPARYRVVCCGRRWGKSLLAAHEAICTALVGGQVFVVGGDYNSASIIFEQCWDISLRINKYVAQRKRQDPPIIRFKHGGFVMARSAENVNQLVGRGLDLVIVDEAGKIADANVWQQYLRPALSDTLGHALFISTPEGRNWFWEVWLRGQNPDYPQYASWRFPSCTNPYLDASELEAARAELPERVFRQEYEAEFLEDVGGVFSHVRERATAKRPSSRNPMHRYVIGVDLAKHQDWTVAIVLDATSGEMCDILRMQKQDYSLQVERIVRMAFHWQAPVCVDATGVGEPVAEEIYRRGVTVVPFTFTQASKLALVQDLVLAFEQGAIAILPEEWLIQELEMYKYERTPSGNLRMGAPEGQHDDGVMALALAWHIAVPFQNQAAPRVGGRRPVSRS
jgi:hypothetical protein